MKKLIMMMLAVTMLVSCDNSDKPKLLDQGAMLYINVKEEGMRVNENDTPPIEGDEFERLTPHELVRLAGMFVFYDPTSGVTDATLGIADVQKDLVNNRIKMWGEMVISKDGSLNEYFLDLRDIRIAVPVQDGDIGGYIPNAVMEQASKDIKQAYNEGRYDDVYKLFEEAYTAIPITAKEWEALKAEGKQ